MTVSPADLAVAAGLGSAEPADGGVLRSKGAGRGDVIFKAITAGAGLLVLAVLAFIAVSTTRQAMPAFQHEGVGFVTSSTWSPSNEQFGALAFIYGTVISSLIALVIAVPVSLGIALLANEAAPLRLRQPIAYTIDLLAAIPSVVYGLWGVLVFAPWIQERYDTINGAVGEWPVLGAVFGGNPQGKSFMTAGLILAIMIIPIITALSREVINTVPNHQREAAVALGSTRWEMIRSAVLPWARGGITGSVMLGLGRAMGETIAAALVIGASAQITLELFSPGDSMPAVIANQFGEAGSLHRAALIGLGVVLFAVTIVVNMSARAIVARFDRRHGGRG
ncbi:MAG: phosphate ABC transporter permease subunit PstC [Acidimicrobiales bacterium]|nr:phosphate ABC transporter permease subunit PstC [Acidimicrobiales bacterium]MCB1258926.1 phosphate ABC transporter permease subunit PstC [Acidimicrobiales bacterium]